LNENLANNAIINPKAFWPYCNTKMKNKPRLGHPKSSKGALVQGDKEEEADLFNE